MALILTIAPACGGSSNPPGQGPPGGGSGDTISGRERIGWVQQAQDASQLATFDYAIYVDGTRRVLSGETCTAASGGGFDCSAVLPAMTAGQHTLELATFVTFEGQVLESARSEPLRVTVAASLAPVESTVPQHATLVTSDGHRFRATVVARSLDDPTDLAVAADGRIFVAERAGRVRIAGPDGVEGEPALVLDQVATSDDAGLTAIALHPDFDRTGHVYVAYAAEGRDGPAYRIARFRERDGILAQGAVVARERASLAQHVVMRFGADGRLYAGFAAGNDPRDAQNPASVLGKILRMNDDGTTPRDNPGASLVFSSGHKDPRALAWHPSTHTLWEVERDRDAGDELNMISAGKDYGWPLVRGAAAHARSVAAMLVFPARTDVSGAAFVPVGSASPLAGELLVASRGAEDLLRIQLGSSAGPGLVEGMLQGRYGRIAAVHVSQDGTIHLVTGNRDTWGPGRDVLLTVAAAR